MKLFSSLFIILLFPLNSLASEPTDKPIFISEFIGQVDFVKSRMLQLAEVMPNDKYDWMPSEGVRTFGEIFVHTAEANYYFISLITGDTSNLKQEKSTTEKEEVLTMLNKSFDWLKEEANKLTEKDLNREVEAFGMKFSVRNFLVTLLNHCHEHLGQSIAYARINRITPPWSMKE